MIEFQGQRKVVFSRCKFFGIKYARHNRGKRKIFHETALRLELVFGVKNTEILSRMKSNTSSAKSAFRLKRKNYKIRLGEKILSLLPDRPSRE